jgi:hypothetical protein
MLIEALPYCSHVMYSSAWQLVLLHLQPTDHLFLDRDAGRWTLRLAHQPTKKGLIFLILDANHHISIVKAVNGITIAKKCHTYFEYLAVGYLQARPRKALSKKPYDRVSYNSVSIHLVILTATTVQGRYKRVMTVIVVTLAALRCLIAFSSCASSASF